MPAPTVAKNPVLTYTIRDGVIPLCECIRDGVALDGFGSLEKVPWVALEANNGASGELRADPPAVSGLRNGAALGIAGTWDGW